jgi:hypothetical protein
VCCGVEKGYDGTKLVGWAEGTCGKIVCILVWSGCIRTAYLHTHIRVNMKERDVSSKNSIIELIF